MYEAANRRTQQEKFLRLGKEGFCVTNNEAGTGSIAEKAAEGKAPQQNYDPDDITEDCGVNRMTFYYHFKDIYDLVDWILTEDATKAMEGCQSFDTWTEAFLDILHRIRDNKALVLNVYRSLGREQVEQYLYKLLDLC